VRGTARRAEGPAGEHWGGRWGPRHGRQRWPAALRGLRLRVRLVLGLQYWHPSPVPCAQPKKMGLWTNNRSQVFIFLRFLHNAPNRVKFGLPFRTFKFVHTFQGVQHKVLHQKPGMAYLQYPRGT
jgi:hypothetical protein